MNTDKSPLQELPDPQVIRERLAKLMTEQTLLRRMLKLAEESQSATSNEREAKRG